MILSALASGGTDASIPLIETRRKVWLHHSRADRKPHCCSTSGQMCLKSQHTYRDLHIFDLAQQLFHSALAPSVPSPYYTRINIISLSFPLNMWVQQFIHTSYHSFLLTGPDRGWVRRDLLHSHEGQTDYLLGWEERRWIGVGGWGGGIESFGVFIIRVLALV